MHLFQQVSWRNWTVLGRRCSVTDRRSGEDRRREHNLDYFSNGGVERRSWQERRSQVERRRDWLRVTKWSSVLLAALTWQTERFESLFHN